MRKKVPSVKDVLRDLGMFQYIPNHGNLGDLLIDVSTRQMFRRWNITAFSEPCSHIVYGGGGRFVPFYSSLDNLQSKLTSPSIRRCVILPHSFYGVDAFVRALDERHIVFCREPRSLRYCRTLNKKALFIPAHDMALGLNPVELDSYASDFKCEDIKWFKSQVFKGVRESLFTISLAGKEYKCAFFPRGSSESALPQEVRRGVDLSDLWNGYGTGSLCQLSMVRTLIDALSTLDFVFSDRLHICIAALYAGCRVCFIDNNYGKLSSIYYHSLSHHPRAYYVPPAILGQALINDPNYFSVAVASILGAAVLNTTGAISALQHNKIRYVYQ